MLRATLPNGLRVVLAENHTTPLVFLSWTSPAGFEADPAGLEGLASLTPLLLRDRSACRGGDDAVRFRFAGASPEPSAAVAFAGDLDFAGAIASATAAAAGAEAAADAAPESVI